jgi:hypothetical protein
VAPDRRPLDRVGEDVYRWRRSAVYRPCAAGVTGGAGR